VTAAIADVVHLLAKLLSTGSTKHTMPMLVDAWKTGGTARQKARGEIPVAPFKRKDDCERIVALAIVEDYIDMNLEPNAYSHVCYLRLSAAGARVVSSLQPVRSGRCCWVAEPPKEKKEPKAAKSTKGGKGGNKGGKGGQGKQAAGQDRLGPQGGGGEKGKQTQKRKR